MANALCMSPHAHLGLALDMLEHLPTTPASLSFTSRIPLLMAHSPEALAYQGESLESNNFQLIKDSTGVVVLNQKLQQLLTMPMPATALQGLNAFHLTKPSSTAQPPSTTSNDDAPNTSGEADDTSVMATQSTDPEGVGSSDEEQPASSSRSISILPTLLIPEGKDSKEECRAKC